MERFAKIVNGLKPSTIFAKRSILDVWQGSEYDFEINHLMEPQTRRRNELYEICNVNHGNFNNLFRK